MFMFHNEEYLRLLEADRERVARQHRLQGELPAGTSGQREGLRRRLAAAWEAANDPGQRRSRPANPCPEMTEAVTA